jgi:hypothetical protein
MLIQVIVFCLVLAVVMTLAVSKSAVGILAVGGVIVAWQLLTRLLPVHTHDEYAKAAEKWSTGLPLALIGIMDMIAFFGSFLVCIASFFVLGILRALAFCGVVVLVLVVVPGMKYGRQINRAMQKKS